MPFRCVPLLPLSSLLLLELTPPRSLASQTIEDTNLIPLHSDLVHIIRAADDFKDLDEALVRNFDLILLTTMNVIYKIHAGLKESPFGDAGRQQVSSVGFLGALLSERG